MFTLLSIQFAITVGHRVIHRFIFLPVLLLLVGPCLFMSTKQTRDMSSGDLEISEEMNDKTEYLESFCDGVCVSLIEDEK